MSKKTERCICSKHRGISLIKRTYKLYSSLINKRVAKISENFLQEEHNGFRMERSCIARDFIIKQLIEKRTEFNLETHLAFIDYDKAFDRVARGKLENS